MLKKCNKHPRNRYTEKSLYVIIAVKVNSTRQYNINCSVHYVFQYRPMSNDSKMECFAVHSNNSQQHWRH